MLHDLESGKVNTVVAVDLDRLLRSTSDLVKLIDLGAKVVTVNGEIDLSTADGEFRATMLAGIARFEVRRKAERQERANLDRVSKGRPVPGRRRYGFESDGVTLRPAEAERVRWLFDEVAAGASILSLLKRLEAEGVKPTTGTEWTRRRLRDMLLTPAYWGAVRHGGNVYPGADLPRVVEPELAERVAAIIQDDARRTSPGVAVKHLYSGIARCGVCGRALVYMRAYRCQNNASHPSMAKHLFEAQALDWLASNVSLLMREAPAASAGAALEVLRAERADLLKRRSRAQELAADPDFDLTEARATVRALARQIEELDSKIDSAEVASAQFGIMGVFAARRDLAGDFWSGGLRKLDKNGVPVLDLDAYRAAQGALADELRHLWAEDSPKALDEKRRFLRATVRIVLNSAKSDLPRLAISPVFTTTTKEES